MKVIELKTFSSEPIDFRSGEIFVVVAAESTVTHIVDHDDDDIRFC